MAEFDYSDVMSMRARLAVVEDVWRRGQIIEARCAVGRGDLREANRIGRRVASFDMARRETGRLDHPEGR